VTSAKLQLSYCRITAPITGRVGLRLVDPGNIVQADASTGLLVITQVQPIAVLFPIPEDALPRVVEQLRAGRQLPVDALNRDASARLAGGVLTTIDNQIDPTTGTVRLKAVFPNADLALFPNQFVNARLLLDRETNKVVVPQVAIRQGPQGPFVFVVDEKDAAHMRQVRLGTTSGGDAVIESGVASGDRVITDGLDDIRDGTRIRVENTATPHGARRGR
jgi:multidrug efflux system membrane fusion protein